MEERLPPSAHANEKPPLPPTTAASLETYVVQVPRDQIYRVPPPEHAAILEHHTRNSSGKPKTRRRPICWILIPAVLLLITALAAVVAVRAILYSPAPPQFAITHIQGKNNTHRTPEFDVTLRAHNANTRMSVSYQGGGEAFLVFKNQKIGQGRIIPSTIKQDSNGAVADVPVVLVGNAAPLSTAEMKKGLNDAAEKAMAMKITAAIEINSWVRNERRDLRIYCDLKVRDSLMNKTTKITSQECRTEFD